MKKLQSSYYKVFSTSSWNADTSAFMNVKLSILTLKVETLIKKTYLLIAFLDALTPEIEIQI
jgi:hypothetical protein